MEGVLTLAALLYVTGILLFLVIGWKHTTYPRWVVVFISLLWLPFCVIASFIGPRK